MFIPGPQTLASVLPSPGGDLSQFFVNCAIIYDLPAELLAAVCYRESLFGAALTPRGPGGRGDYRNGSWHGYGLMQIDIGSHSDWLMADNQDGSLAWPDPGSNIDKGAEILATARLDLHTDNPLVYVPAYNAGYTNVSRAISAGRSPDSVTTGKNYGADVVAHAVRWHDECRQGSACMCCLCTYGH